MTNKRKRKRSGTFTIHDNKSLKKREKGWVIRHAVLAHYYSHVSTLREYLNKLQLNSKTDEIESWAAAKSGYDKQFVEVASFLDHTWIGTKSCNVVSQEEKWKHWNAFSQQSTDPASFFRNQGAESSQSKVKPFHLILLSGNWPVRLSTLQYGFSSLNYTNQAKRIDISCLRDIVNMQHIIPGIKF